MAYLSVYRFIINYNHIKWNHFYKKKRKREEQKRKEGKQMINLKNRIINHKVYEKNQKETAEPKRRGRKRIPVLPLIVIAVIAGTILWNLKQADGPGIAEKGKDFLVGEEGKVTTVTESTLKETVKESRLYTAEYPYNGYTAVYDEDGETVKYYVAYEGSVKAGIDASQIEVSLDKDTIFIHLPEVEVEKPYVNPGTMEYIFKNKKYDTETVAQEAYKAALSDLTERACADRNLVTIAEESAKASERALVEPWVNQLGDGNTYTVRVLAYEEEG